MGTILSRLTGRRSAGALENPGEIELRAAGVRVVIVPAWGGRISVLELGGRQWLAPGDVPNDDPFRRAADAALAGAFEECLPTVAPCRLVSRNSGLAIEFPALGEAHTLRTAVSIATLDGAVEATCVWTGERMAYRLTRVVRVSPGEVSMRYELTNRGPAPMPFIWAANVALPLGEETRIVLPDNVRAQVISQEGIDLLGAGTEHRWPRFRTAKKLVDMSVPDALGGRFAYHLSVDVPTGIVTIAEGASRLECRLEGVASPRIGLAVRRKLGGAGARIVTIQPAIGVPEALAGPNGVEQSAEWLEPGETRRWQMTWRSPAE